MAKAKAVTKPGKKAAARPKGKKLVPKILTAPSMIVIQSPQLGPEDSDTGELTWSISEDGNLLTLSGFARPSPAAVYVMFTDEANNDAYGAASPTAQIFPVTSGSFQWSAPLNLQDTAIGSGPGQAAMVLDPDPSIPVVIQVYVGAPSASLAFELTT